MTNLEGMTQARWDKLTLAEKVLARDNSDLSPQLIGLEGWRVEVCDEAGNFRRFIVGKSTGWRPCHLEVKTKRSLGGDCACKSYRSVYRIERVR
jgi:hypothetical protein